MKSREGDLLETYEDLIFDVKGIIHPPDRIVAFVRYFPNAKGGRRKNGLAYGKVYSFSERYALLKEKFPKYLAFDPVFDETLCEVATSDVREHFDPVRKLQQLRRCNSLDSLETKALQLGELLKDRSNISRTAIGISGSILTGLHGLSSDIDPIIYGSANCQRAYFALREMLKDSHSPFNPYSTRELKSLFDFRSKDTLMSFEQFVRTESRKAMQGKFADTDYFVRFVKDWNEIDQKYGDIKYKNMGYAKIKAMIVDDSESIFTPCRYTLEGTAVIEGPKLSPITEIASFRGRFCEQAINGETVIAQGKVESVTDTKHHDEYCRLLIGNKPSDFMILM